MKFFFIYSFLILSIFILLAKDKLLCYHIFVDYLNSLPQIPSFAFPLLILWGLFWKGMALWKSAKNDQRNWFIVILILNTVGILEIAYLFKFAKQKLTLKELKIWESKSK